MANNALNLYIIVVTVNIFFTVNGFISWPKMVTELPITSQVVS